MTTKQVYKNLSVFGLLVIVSVIAVIISIDRQDKPINPSQITEPIKIGFIGPLSGDASQWGVPPMRGARLAIETINKSGGIFGQQVELVTEDSQCDPSQAVTAFNGLMAKSVDMVIGAVCSGSTLAIAPLAEESKILLVSPASTSPKITMAGDFVFRVVPSDALRGQIFAEYIYGKVGLKKVAILYINNEAGAGNRDSFKGRFEKLGGEVVMTETYEQGATDLRTQISKIAQIKPEAIVAVTHLEDAMALIKQTKELNIEIPLYFQTEAIEDPSVIKATGQASEGVVYILPAQAEGDVVDKFQSLYAEKYDKAPELFAAEAYDAVNLIADGIKKTTIELNTRRLRDYLYQVQNYRGASGVITFDNNGDVEKPMAIKQIIDGEKEVIDIR